jgi:hypothetical protein
LSNWAVGRQRVKIVLVVCSTLIAWEHVYVEAEPKTQKSRHSVLIAPSMKERFGLPF